MGCGPPDAPDPSSACLESVLGLSGVRHDQGLYFDGLQHRKDLRLPATGATAIFPALFRQSVVKLNSQHHRQCETAPTTSLYQHGMTYGLGRPGYAGSVSCLSHILQKIVGAWACRPLSSNDTIHKLSSPAKEREFKYDIP